MKIALILAALFSVGAQSLPAKNQESQKHEKKEDQKRTVPGGASMGIQQCHDDIEVLCKGVMPGQGRLGQCLKKNSKKLSKACRTWLKHGGQGHVDSAYLELDTERKNPAVPISTATATGAQAPVKALP